MRRPQEFYGLVYEREPDGNFALEALKGLVESLLRGDKNELAFPMMEQLYLRQNDTESES